MESVRKRRWPWGRIIAGAVAAVILFFAVDFLVSAAECQRFADAAQTAEPIHLKVDLSKPGVYTGEFRHTFTIAHGDYLVIGLVSWKKASSRSSSSLPSTPVGSASSR